MNEVLIAAPISDAFREFLQNRQLKPRDFDAGQGGADQTNICGIITSNKLILDRAVLEQFPSLKWIARLGSGMEIIDREYCHLQGIRCFSSPNGIANSVAEHVTGMVLALLHRITSSENEIRRGLWKRESNRGEELSSRTVGIIGYGHTGSALAKKLAAFTPRVLVYDKYRTGFSNDSIQEVTLEQLRLQADLVSFHVPLSEETRYYYNREFMESMNKPHILVNASRGSVVQTSAVLQGLRSGKIEGACLDVLEEEAQIEHILSSENNIIQQLFAHKVILTPHIAGYSKEAVTKMSAELMEQLRALFPGQQS